MNAVELSNTLSDTTGGYRSTAILIRRWRTSIGSSLLLLLRCNEHIHDHVDDHEDAVKPLRVTTVYVSISNAVLKKFKHSMLRPSSTYVFLKKRLWPFNGCFAFNCSHQLHIFEHWMYGSHCMYGNHLCCDSISDLQPCLEADALFELSLSRVERHDEPCWMRTNSCAISLTLAASQSLLMVAGGVE